MLEASTAWKAKHAAAEKSRALGMGGLPVTDLVTSISAAAPPKSTVSRK